MGEKLIARARQYTAELVEQYQAGALSTDELRAALAEIPGRVYSDVCVRTAYGSEEAPNEQ